MAACYEKLKDYENMAEAGRSCIKVDRSFIKGYYRLAVAHRALNNLPACIKTLESGLAVEASNPDLKRMKKEVTELQRGEQGAPYCQQVSAEAVRRAAAEAVRRAAAAGTAAAMRAAAAGTAAAERDAAAGTAAAMRAAERPAAAGTAAAERATAAGTAAAIKKLDFESRFDALRRKTTTRFS